MNKLIKTILYLGALILSLGMSGSNTVLARSTDKPIISTFRTYNTRDTLNIGGGANVNMSEKLLIHRELELVLFMVQTAPISRKIGQ